MDVVDTIIIAHDAVDLGSADDERGSISARVAPLGHLSRNNRVILPDAIETKGHKGIFSAWGHSADGTTPPVAIADFTVKEWEGTKWVFAEGPYLKDEDSQKARHRLLDMISLGYDPLWSVSYHISDYVFVDKDTMSMMPLNVKKKDDLPHYGWGEARKVWMREGSPVNLPAADGTGIVKADGTVEGATPMQVALQKLAVSRGNVLRTMPKPYFA